MACEHTYLGHICQADKPYHMIGIPERCRYWKNGAARALKTDDRPLWQRDFWDTQLRSSDSYEQKWEYVRYNPVRHKLCLMAADWPFQGEIHQLYRRED
jgi:hypothetical protein